MADIISSSVSVEKTGAAGVYTVSALVSSDGTYKNSDRVSVRWNSSTGYEKLKTLLIEEFTYIPEPETELLRLNIIDNIGTDIPEPKPEETLPL